MISKEKQIKTKQQMKEWLKYELSRYPHGRFSSFAEFFELNETSIKRKYNTKLRHLEYYLNTGKKVRAAITRIKLNKLMNKYCLRIPPNCVEKGLKIMHVGPILINGRASIGKNCSLHINTTIAAKGISDDAPILGNGVVVGVGSVILGGVSIADNVAIGANSVVTKNITEENIAVAGAPAKKVSNNGSLEWSITKKR